MPDEPTYPIGTLLTEYVRGRMTPTGGTPLSDEELKYRAKLIEQLTELNKLHGEYIKSATTQWTDMEKGLWTTRADTLSAMGNIMQAAAMSQQARADYMGAVQDLLKASMPIFMRQGDKTVLDAFRRDRVLPTVLTLNTDLQDDTAAYDLLIREGSAGGVQTDEQGRIVSIDPQGAAAQAFMQRYGTKVVTDGQSSALSAIGTMADTGTSRLYTARIMADNMASGVMDAGLAWQSDRISPEVRRTLMANIAAEAKARIVGGVAGDRGLIPQAVVDQANIEDQRATDLVNEARERIPPLLGSGTAESKAALNILDEWEVALRGGPEYLGSLTKDMPGPSKYANEEALIKAELRRLSEKEAGHDPMLLAMRRLETEVPYYSQWKAAMRFRSPESAVFYLHRHPGEITAFLQMARENPDIARDPLAVRAWAEQMRKQTGEGFLQTGIGRTFNLKTFRGVMQQGAARRDAKARVQAALGLDTRGGGARSPRLDSRTLDALPRRLALPDTAESPQETLSAMDRLVPVDQQPATGDTVLSEGASQVTIQRADGSVDVYTGSASQHYEPGSDTAKSKAAMGAIADAPTVEGGLLRQATAEASTPAPPAPLDSGARAQQAVAAALEPVPPAAPSPAAPSTANQTMQQRITDAVNRTLAPGGDTQVPPKRPAYPFLVE